MSNCCSHETLLHEMKTFETCEINTPLQTQDRSCSNFSHRHNSSRRLRYHSSGSSPEPADTARESDFQVTLGCIHQRNSLQYPLSQAPVSCFPELPATRVLSDQRVSTQRCGHGVASDQSHSECLSQLLHCSCTQDPSTRSGFPMISCPT